MFDQKKVKVLQKELPLLSRLFGEMLIVLWTFKRKNWPPQVLQDKTITSHKIPPNNRATEFSNLESSDIETDADKDLKCQNSDEFALLVKDNSTPATEFSNVKCDATTKNGNSKNPINITKYSPNPSAIIQLVMKIPRNQSKRLNF